MMRAIDCLLAAVALICVFQLLAVAAVLVRLSSPGPIFFGQPRLGKSGRVFRILKFRTMIDGAGDLRNPDGSAYTGDHDPRVTPVGQWLRRTSLDELPQLFNVIRGEMSLVGPRPDLPDQIRFYTGEEMRKLEVRPGITGLAQISGRNAISWARRKELDVEYVDRRSVLLDIAILARTIPYVLLRRDVTEPSVDAALGSNGRQS